MSHPERHSGFTLVELLIVIVLSAVLVTSMYVFFNSSLLQYFTLQKDGTYFTDLAMQSQRIANVVRGATDITTASPDDLVLYAYFSPKDSVVSQVHYYENATKTVLYADVTPMTANPPDGTLVTSQARTYTIIPNFYQAPGTHLFAYLDAAGNPLSVPISDLHTIKGVTINLAVPSTSKDKGQSLVLQVSLRNRKTNL